MKKKKPQHVWFGKKIKGGTAGGVLRQKGMHNPNSLDPYFHKQHLREVNSSNSMAEENFEHKAIDKTMSKLDQLQNSGICVFFISDDEETKEYSVQQSSTQNTSNIGTQTAKLDENTCPFCLAPNSELEPITNQCSHMMCNR